MRATAPAIGKFPSPAAGALAQSCRADVCGFYQRSDSRPL